MRLWGWVWMAACGGAPGAGDDHSDVVVDTGETLAVATCTLGSTCASLPAEGGAHASWRPDVFYPSGPGVVGGGGDPEQVFGSPASPTFPEAGIRDPLGGRLHVVLTATAGGRLASMPSLPRAVAGGRGRAAPAVRVGGELASERIERGELDWVRVWPTTFEVGDPVWVSLHARDPALGPGARLALALPLEGGGTAFDGEVQVVAPPVVVTSVALADDRAVAWVHLRNDDAVPHTLDRLVWGGQDRTQDVCAAVPTLEPGGTAVWQVPTCEVPALGEVWTLVVSWREDVAPAVAGGRVLPAHFPIHTWPDSKDCPLPSVNDTTFAAHREQGFDTLFVRGRYAAEGCVDRPTEAVIDEAFEQAGVWAMLDEWTPMPERTDRVAARLLGDEVDDKGLETLLGEQRMRGLAEETAWMNEATPEVPTYIGASRHRFTGMFAGAADLQGMDMYHAACAPHITDFGVHPPLWAPYAYLRATRDNHLPGPTWLYAQGLGGWASEPTAMDVRWAALAAVAAGAKGLMWFQSKLEQAAAHPATWEAMGRVNRDVAALAPWLRLGDPTGAAQVTAGEAIVEAVRVPEALVLVVLPTAVTQGPTDLECALRRYTPFVLADQELDVEVALPDDLGVDEVFELRDGALLAPAAEVEVRGRRLRLTGLAVEDATGARVLVVAGTPGVREQLEERLGR